MTIADRRVTRRHALLAGGALAIAPWLPARADERDIANIPALAAFDRQKPTKEGNNIQFEEFVIM